MAQTRRAFLQDAILGTASVLLGCFRPSRPSTLRDAGTRVFDVTRMGAVADGRTFIDDAIQRGVQALVADGGGVLRFPPGTYRVGNSRAITLENCSGITFFGPGATLRNDTYAGFDGAVLLLTGVCRNVGFLGLRFETETSSPNAYDNTLSFYSREPRAFEHLRFIGCHFARASNKHLNIDGPATDVVIDRCTFERGNQNSHPGPNASRMAAVFFRFDGGNPQHVRGVRITNCTFADEGLFSISLDQFDGAPKGQYYFSDVVVQDNSFLRSSGGVWIRADDVTIDRNYFEDVGLTQATRTYELDSNTGRFFSRVRAQFHQVASPDNSLRIQRAAVVECFDAAHVQVRHNIFVRCGEAQATAGIGTNLEGLCISASKARSAVFRDNEIFERQPLPAVPPAINCSTAAGSYDVQCAANRVLIGTSMPHAPMRATVDWTRARP